MQKIAELAGKVIDLGQTSQINSSRTVVRMDRGSTAADVQRTRPVDGYFSKQITNNKEILHRKPGRREISQTPFLV